MNIIIIGCGTSGNQIIPLLDGCTIIDRDIIEEKNLTRQPLFTSKDIGKPKAQVLAEKYNLPYHILDLDYTNIDILSSADLIIDCTDNLQTRFLINDFAIKNNIPWIYTGIVTDLSRVMSITGEYCFSCIFSAIKGLDTCSTAGVDLETAKQMAQIVLEEIQRIRQGKKGRGLWANNEWLTINKNPECKTCQGVYEYLEGKQEKVVKYCGSSRYQFKGEFDFEKIKERLNGKGDWFIHEDIYIFKERIVVKAKTQKEAEKKFSKIIGW
jgi:molybdopterin-synthase adenylyltransferase